MTSRAVMFRFLLTVFFSMCVGRLEHCLEVKETKRGGRIQQYESLYGDRFLVI